ARGYPRAALSAQVDADGPPAVPGPRRRSDRGGGPPAGGRVARRRTGRGSAVPGGAWAYGAGREPAASVAYRPRQPRTGRVSRPPGATAPPERRWRCTGRPG